MPVETDEDLAGMFDADEFAVLAKYVPVDGVPKEDVPVILSEPDIDVGTKLVGIRAHQRVAFIQVASLDVPPAAGDRLDMGFDSFRVRKATADLTRKVYTIELSPAS